jgi:beta-galactosidase
MREISFNEGWYCRHLDEEGMGAAVTLPHDAMLSERRTELSAGGINTGWYEGHDYCYTKKFTAPGEWADKSLILEFEGVYRKAEVWLNGEKLLFRPYGYTNFYVDITGKVKTDTENELRVIARNADQPNSRWYSGAGIYRPVKLWIADREHICINGVRIKTLSCNPAKVEVSVQTSTEGEVQIEILDGDQVVAGAKTKSRTACELTIPQAKLWSTETPNLYTCRVQFAQDTQTVSFGVRTLEWGKKGLLLNGKRVILRGACIHHDHAMLGACCYADAEERRVRILKENGYNALRSAHNPCSKALLDACDRQGMLMMDEYIDHWYIHKTEYDYVDYFAEWWKQDLKDMVEKDYNHPSVVLYSTGNEVSETAQKKGIALTKDMTDYLHTLDDTRPVTCGVNIFFNFLSSIGFGVYSDDKAKKEAQKAQKAQEQGANPKKKKAVGSEFFNNLAGIFGSTTMKVGATLHGCDVKTRDAFANMDIAGYNYGILRYRHDLKKYPDRLILGSETFCDDAYKFYEFAQKNPRIIGDFVWAGMDYLGEVGIGSWEYADYAPRFDHGCGWVSAGSGRIDLTGKPLGEALYTRVALDREKGPLLAVCPVNHTGEKHSPSAWKMSNAMDSWSFRGCEGKSADVEVYARAASVALVINGKQVDKKQLKGDCIARFHCTYESGVIEAVAYDQAGRETGRKALKTAGEKTVLSADAEQKTVQPGHLSYIRLRYTDENGITKPLERGKLKVSVEGGKLLGLGSACPYQEGSFLDDETDTYYGEAMAVVMAGEAGRLTLEVTDGHYHGTAEVEIKEA